MPRMEGGNASSSLLPVPDPVRLVKPPLEHLDHELGLNIKALDKNNIPQPEGGAQIQELNIPNESSMHHGIDLHALLSAELFHAGFIRVKVDENENAAEAFVRQCNIAIGPTGKRLIDLTAQIMKLVKMPEFELSISDT